MKLHAPLISVWVIVAAIDSVQFASPSRAPAEFSSGAFGRLSVDEGSGTMGERLSCKIRKLLVSRVFKDGF